MRKAVVRQADGLVLNAIEIEDGAKWPVPDGCALVLAPDSGGPGDTWDGTKFVSPPVALPPPDWKSQWQAATAPTDKLVVLGKYFGWQ